LIFVDRTQAEAPPIIIEIKTEPFHIPDKDPGVTGGITKWAHRHKKIAGVEDMVKLKRIKIRLDRSEVTNYLASIGKAFPAPGSLSVVPLKAELR